jgi:hypothetical protein
MVAYLVEHQNPTLFGDMALKTAFFNIDEAMVEYAIASRSEKGRVILWKFRRSIHIPWPVQLLMLPFFIPFDGPPSEFYRKKVALLDYDFEPARREAERLKELAEWRGVQEANRV